MGGMSALESGRRLLPPDTPPDLVSPTSSGSSRSSPATDAAWPSSRSLVSPPMSDYDKDAKAAAHGEKEAEGGAHRAVPNPQSSQRQQLPSLSSLFGPPTARPLQSPISDRPTSYAAVSPLDRPRIASAPRSHTDSYFPPTLSPPLPQSRPPYDVAERTGSENTKRPSTGSDSPRFRSMNHGSSESRPEVQSGPRWAALHDQARTDYSLGSRDTSFRSASNHFRLQFPTDRDHSHGFADPRTSSASHNPPSTPTSTTVPDGLTTSKDGLGPKIWTGTHFLPRFVRAAEVPGEGLCYFYDDGTHCKTVIDGEAVNAHWGVTKAGKPRKRLAIACVTCREKKIKCDPDYPRCVQCEKFGRICKFKNAPRGGHNGSPSTPPEELDDGGRQLGARRLSETGSTPPVSPPGHEFRQPTPDQIPAKRIKIDHHSYIPNGEPSPAFSRPVAQPKSQISTPIGVQEMPRIPDSVLGQAWQTDPYVTDPQSINAVITHFFAHVNSTMIIQFLPEQATRAWVANSVHRKSPEDLVLLYSLLALGVALSGGPKHIAYEYAQVALYGQKVTEKNCLQLAQSRILLAVYFTLVSRRCEAEAMVSAAASTAVSLKLNLELDKTVEANSNSFPLGLNRAGYSEARRRTLWSLFVLERLGGLFPDRLTMINPGDIYLRLPADARTFEEQMDSNVPFFSPEDSSFSKASDHLYDGVRYMVDMVHIWSECQASVYRLLHRPASRETEAVRVRSLVGALERWQSALPKGLSSSRYNLEAAAVGGNLGSYLTMHLLYHHAMIKLYRHIRMPQQLSGETRWNHVQRCQEHATRIFDMADNLDHLLRARITKPSSPPPIVATAIAEAVDVLSASRQLGQVHNVLESVRIMKHLVDATANIWVESFGARFALEQRLHALNHIRDRGPALSSTGEGFRLTSKYEGPKDEKSVYWEMTEPMDKTFAKELDIFYC